MRAPPRSHDRIWTVRHRPRGLTGRPGIDVTTDGRESLTRIGPAAREIIVGTRIRRSLALAAASAASLTMLAGVAVPAPVQAQVQAQAGAPGDPPVNVWITTA